MFSRAGANQTYGAVAIECVVLYDPYIKFIRRMPKASACTATNAKPHVAIRVALLVLVRQVNSKVAGGKMV